MFLRKIDSMQQDFLLSCPWQIPNILATPKAADNVTKCFTSKKLSSHCREAPSSTPAPSSSRPNFCFLLGNLLCSHELSFSPLTAPRAAHLNTSCLFIVSTLLRYVQHGLALHQLCSHRWALFSILNYSPDEKEALAGYSKQILSPRLETSETFFSHLSLITILIVFFISLLSLHHLHHIRKRLP